MKKRRWLVIAAALVLLAAAAVTVGVYAYLQSRTERENKFSVGENTVTVTESFAEPQYMDMQDTIPKDVKVKNTGTSDQFVRVYLDFSDTTVRENATILYGDEKETTWSGFLADPPERWVYIPESDDPDSAVLGGYFYYTTVLAPNTETPSLITGIRTDFHLNSDDTEEDPDKIRDFEIIVYSESVQTVETGTGSVYASADWRDAWKSFLTRTP